MSKPTVSFVTSPVSAGAAELELELDEPEEHPARANAPNVAAQATATNFMSVFFILYPFVGLSITLL